MSDGIALPHGAKGIEVDDLVIEQGNDKIVVLLKSQGDHYTFQAGTRSGIMDLHRTWRDEQGNTRREMLFTMDRGHLTAFLEPLANAPQELLQQRRKLRLGWLARHRIDIVFGLNPTTDEEIAKITTKRKRRLVLNPSALEAAIDIPEYLDDVYDRSDGTFSLMHGDSIIGIGFKTTDTTGTIHLHWIRLRDLNRLFRRWERQLTKTFKQHVVQPRTRQKLPTPRTNRQWTFTGHRELRPTSAPKKQNDSCTN